jgi:hypothetical protein
MKPTILFFFLVAMPSLAHADTQWVLKDSSLVYHISHPLHQSEGMSHAARGKGICRNGQCEFLVAAPVKSFDSGDSNRDLHMLQATHGAQFPIVTVRTQLPESAMTSATVHADLEIQFAGQTANYSQIPLLLVIQGSEAHLTGTIPATLSDFKIAPPSLLAIPVKNDMPIRIDMTWRRE